jgi:Lrp/AsnC ligand binding domain
VTPTAQEQPLTGSGSSELGGGIQHQFDDRVDVGVAGAEIDDVETQPDLAAVAHCREPAEVSPQAMGIGLQAFVAVRLVRTSRDAFRALHAHVVALPEVLAVFHVSGVYDLQIHVAVRDVTHLRDLIVDQIATRKEVDRCETSVIYAHERKPRLPQYLLPAPGKSERGRRRP